MTAKIRIKFRPPKFRIYLDRIRTMVSVARAVAKVVARAVARAVAVLVAVWWLQ